MHICCTKNNGIDYLQVQESYYESIDGKSKQRKRVIKNLGPQTDGKPLPTLVEDLTGDVRNYELFLEALRDVSPLPIVFEPLPSGVDGQCRFGDRISIRPGMSEIQTISAVIHEITHAKLHDKALQNENAEPKDNRTKEVEAESVSYVVCQHYGIETGANSFGYVANWSKSRELKELSASLDTIHSAASELMTGIDAAFRRLAKERGIVLSVGAETPARGAEYEPVLSETPTEIFEPNEIFTQYADLVTTVVMNDKAYEPFRTGDDIADARSASDAAIARAVTGLITMSPEHIPLAKEYIENPKFQKQLGYHVFLKTHIEPRAAEKTVEAEREAEVEQPPTPRDNAVAQGNYEAFENLFPEIISGEYRQLRLEDGQGVEPLSIERISDDRISIMHSYLADGQLVYDPMIVFMIDREARMLNPVEYQLSSPPLYQRLDENGIGISIDGNGRESTMRGLQVDLDDFMSQWLDGIGQQGFYPVHAVKIIDGMDVEISFDNDGNPIEPDIAPRTEENEPIGADKTEPAQAAL